MLAVEDERGVAAEHGDGNVRRFRWTIPHGYGLPRLCVVVLAVLVEFHVAAREADITHARQRNTVVAVGDPPCRGTLG
nr:MAG TPA: hypothetical protein [Bacteriophage sp.]